MRSVAPILNPMTLTIPEPMELVPGYLLRRATEREIQLFRHLIDQQCPYPSMIALAHYEGRRITRRTETGGYQEQYVDAPPTEWRYNVITLPRTDFRAVNELEQISNVAAVQFELPLHILDNGGTGGHGWRAAHFLSERLGIQGDPPILDERAVQDFRDAHTEFMAVKEQFPEVGSALQLLDALKSLPAVSDFEVIGLFAIIEMLITHNPELEDAGDSITHQMKRKIPLLSRRFKQPLDYSRFSGLSEEKIWAKMYAYRSSIAHGGEPDFSRGELQALKSRRDAISFLREVARALIRHSFKEPQLYRDLKQY